MTISDLIFFEKKDGSYNNSEYARFIRNHVIANNSKEYNITEKIQLAAKKWNQKNKKRKISDISK
jgi:hypothetical protein